VQRRRCGMQSDGGFWDESVATLDVVRDDGVGQKLQDGASDGSGQAERASEIGLRSLGLVRGEADSKVARRDTSLEVGGCGWERKRPAMDDGCEVEARGGSRRLVVGANRNDEMHRQTAGFLSGGPSF
jgi:hypothetical protein